MTAPTPPQADEPPGPGAGAPRGEGAPDAATGETVTIAVTVTRTGGFAGLHRTWHAQPDTDDAPHWIAMIDGCPWDAAAPDRPVPPSGADRFQWRVDARCGDSAREAALADPEVQGPWRELIDAVRAAQPGRTTPRDAR